TDERVEAVERTRRWSADADSLEVVDPAVAGADKRRRGGDEPDGTADVGATRGDRDHVVVLILRRAVHRGAVAAHVRDRLTRLADPRLDRHDDWGVRRSGEFRQRADVLPGRRLAVEDRP